MYVIHICMCVQNMFWYECTVYEYNCVKVCGYVSLYM